MLANFTNLFRNHNSQNFAKRPSSKNLRNYSICLFFPDAHIRVLPYFIFKKNMQLLAFLVSIFSKLYETLFTISLREYIS